MNKTINELVALTELANDDELIVYDVSEGTSKKIKKSDFVTTTIASGNQKPPTSNAVADALNGKLNTNTYVDVDLNTILDFGMHKIQCLSGNYDALHFPPRHGWGILTVLKPTSNDSNIVQMFVPDHTPVIYIRQINLVTSTFSSWIDVNDVTQITPTIDTSHITNPASNAWVNCYKNNKVVTVSVEVGNGSGSFTAYTANRIAYGLPIPANGVVTGSIFTDDDSRKRVWIDNGNLYVWVVDNYTGSFFASVTYIVA